MLLTMNNENSQTYFEIFSLPTHLVIDLVALEKSFYTLSRKLHPDRFANKSPNEQAAALTASSRLNDAYRTLKDPIARTEYLLKLEGFEMEEQSKSATEHARAAGTTKQQIVPADLLEEVFELNMQLEEMRAAKKSGDDDPQLRRDLLAAKFAFDTKMSAIHSSVESIWVSWDAAYDADDIPAKRAACDAMVALVNRRSYLRNLVRDVNEALDL
jgi:molecular chaperone HscB